MTLTVAPQPFNVPPRVRIDVNTDNPATPFTSLMIYRDGMPIREQPFTGSSETVAFDYEAPFGAKVTYSAEGIVGGAPFSETKTTTLFVDETWLIHPSTPALSIEIDRGLQGGLRAFRFIEASSGESKSSQAQSTIHRPVGRRRAVVVTSGPRQADEWTLVLGAPTIIHKNAVRALVDDQSPLLLRSPADVLSDLPDDWYSVGDVTVQRLEVPVITEETTITLPLIPVDEPIVRRGAVWTYGSDLLMNPTYAGSRVDFPTYLDRLTGEA